MAAGTVALVDGDERAFTYDEIILASFALGSALKRGTRAGECVGVMLPTGRGAAHDLLRLVGLWPRAHHAEFHQRAPRA